MGFRLSKYTNTLFSCRHCSPTIGNGRLRAGAAVSMKLVRKTWYPYGMPCRRRQMKCNVAAGRVRYHLATTRKIID